MNPPASNPDATPSPAAQSLLRPFFLWSLPFTFLYFGLPIIGKDFGATAVGIGGLFSAFTLTTLLLRPVVGWSLDRFGRKSFFVAALVIYAIAMGVFAAADSMSWLYAARLIQGVGSAFLWTTAYTIVADLTLPRQRGKAIGELTQVTNRGGLVGVFAAFAAVSILGEGRGWKVSFAAFAITTFIGAWLAWRHVPDTRPAVRGPRARAVISPSLIKLMVIVFLIAVPEAMLAPIYLIYLQDKFHVEILTLAWAFFPAGLAAAFLSTRLGALSDRFGRAPMMAVGLVGSGIVSLLMPGLNSLVVLAVLYTLTTIMWGLADPAKTAMVSELTGQEVRGAAYGLFDFVQNLGLTAGPLLGGFVYDRISAGGPFYLDGIVLIVGAAWVLLFLRHVGAAQPAESAAS